ncbi:hypothetical protein [Pseudarthrobacter sp. AB1]|uniref:hypothetical protein n=1 Tax=Pseudarthrobacter sp. AB1 TaxID=2138309 RepID=UPI001D041836|nr:hypothetical protein [Pseudarthrobacter sp. AB1]
MAGIALQVYKFASETVILKPGDSARVNPGRAGRYWAPVYARMVTIYGPNPEGLESHSFKYSEL